MDRLDLISRIEDARQLLYCMHMEYGSLLHPEVIQQSVVLDGLINQYNRVKVGKAMN
ncbi:Spo0E family sporulation regulatory protein-aspartic acid phosphatase [Paenibacillus xylanexedens]|uniref:Spo0E family sporulation regulatory protein-aspartic acid phosphatase n=1 Tax=Paenibacillus xylanexedens TaxID=528191 RepID=UPI003B026952